MKTFSRALTGLCLVSLLLLVSGVEDADAAKKAKKVKADTTITNKVNDVFEDDLIAPNSNRPIEEAISRGALACLMSPLILVFFAG